MAMAAYGRVLTDLYPLMVDLFRGWTSVDDWRHARTHTNEHCGPSAKQADTQGSKKRSYLGEPSLPHGSCKGCNHGCARALHLVRSGTMPCGKR